MQLSEEDKIQIFVNLIMCTDIKINYSDDKLVVVLTNEDMEKIRTYLKNKSTLKK
jgi:hypothetical protein